MSIPLNTNQVLAVVRWLIAIGGSAATTYGLISAEHVEAVSAALVTLAPVIWSIFFVHTDSAAVATADKVEGVQGVVTCNTPQGHELANSIPSPTVAPAGSPAAVEIATPSIGVRK